MELVGAWADISERRRAEQQALEANAELQKTKRSLSRLIESSPDAIIATDKNGNVTLFSEGAETLLGYRAEEAIGRSVALLYGGEAGVNEVLREMHKRGGTVSGFEGVLWAKDASAIPVLISASLLFDDDGHGDRNGRFRHRSAANASAARKRFRRRMTNWRSGSRSARKS